MNKKFSELPAREKFEVVIYGLILILLAGLSSGLIPF